MRFEGIVTLPETGQKRVHLSAEPGKEVLGDVVSHRGAAVRPRTASDVLVRFAPEVIERFESDPEAAMLEYAMHLKTVGGTVVNFEGSDYVFATVFDGQFDDAGRMIGDDRLKTPTLIERKIPRKKAVKTGAAAVKAAAVVG